MNYQQKKNYYDGLVTLYGRNVVREVLQDKSINVYKLHLANSNKSDNKIQEIIQLASQAGISIEYHDKKGLSRISKNARQDQGVAIDIDAPNYKSADSMVEHLGDSYRLLALDSIQNPQNLGMIIRSAAAGKISGIILPQQNSAKISPLVMKASAGTLFKIPIFYCQELLPVLKKLKNSQTELYSLSSHAKNSIYQRNVQKKECFILGNENQGIDSKLEQICGAKLMIPMNRGVESLNVAITAALIAFL